MAASPSGIATLVVLLLGGPLCWAAVLLVRRARLTLLAGLQEGAEPAAAAGVAAAKGQEDIGVPASSGSGRGDGEDGAREQMPGTDYLLALMGYAIGIGNLWRFPYMVGKWGGCAFVCAYLVCLFFVAMPLYLLELTLGQHTRRNTLGCFEMIHPRWMGVAYGQAFMLFIVLAYYNVLLAYSCVYIAGSLLDPLPWSEESQLPMGAASGSINAPEAFWKRDVLNKYPGSLHGQGLGPLQGKVAAALFFVWLMVFCSLAFGKKALAKVTWVTVIGPVLLLAILLVRTSMLEGAGAGIEFYLGKFDASLLLDAEMWAGACGQILFSLSPGMGTAITLSSYTHPQEDVLRTCVLVALSNSAFSLVGGFAIFGILGNLALRTGQTVAEVASSGGTGLAFVAIAEGIQNFGSGGNTMAVLFFVMLLSLGLDSTFAWAETMVSYVEDFCAKRGLAPRRSVVVAAVSAVLFLFGLPFCTRMGGELLDVLDHYCASYYLLLGCCLEAVMFHVSFGWDRLQLAIKQATLGNRATPHGRTLSCFWRVCLLVTVPLTTGLLFLRLFISDVMEAYEDYPGFLQAIGWTSLVLCLAITPCGLLMKGGSSLPPVDRGGGAQPDPGKGAPAPPSAEKVAPWRPVPLDTAACFTPKRGGAPSKAPPSTPTDSPRESCCLKGFSFFGILPCAQTV